MGTVSVTGFTFTILLVWATGATVTTRRSVYLMLWMRMRSTIGYSIDPLSTFTMGLLLLLLLLLSSRRRTSSSNTSPSPIAP
uniref:Uncharacterized protein n=1 Tax=Anopheles darlingi TaxID=43151 RepID=A0A2M4DDZ4_ANODA